MRMLGFWRFVLPITFAIAVDVSIQSSNIVQDSSFMKKMAPVVREPRLLWCDKHVDKCALRCVGEKCQRDTLQVSLHMWEYYRTVC